MTDATAMDPRLRAALQTSLDAHVGPHPTWATSPAAARVALDRRRRSPWTGRLLAVAGIVVIGGVAALLAGRAEPDRVGAGCPTLADYAAASPGPGNTASPRDQGADPDVSFPPVPSSAPTTTGVHPPGTWIVFSDEDGPAFQARVRDVRACDRLPTVRSTYPGGSLLLATLDVQQLRAGGLGPWIGPTDLLTYDFGVPRTGTRPVEDHFGVPGTQTRSSLQPPATFTDSTLFILDVPATDASVVVYPDGTDLAPDPAPGWRVREGSPDRPPLPSFPRPGPSATSGQVPLGESATIRRADDPRVGVATVGDVDEVEAYPDVVPPEGSVIVEALVEVIGWPTAAEAATGYPTGDTGAVRWVATDATGTELRSLGDEASLVTEPGRALANLVPSDFPFGYLAFVAPDDGPIRLGLEVDGREVAWWSLRD